MANWNPDQVPTGIDTAKFDVSDTYTVTFDGGNVTNDVAIVDGGNVTFTDDGTPTTYTFDIANSSGIVVQGSSSLTVFGGLTFLLPLFDAFGSAP